MIGSSRRARERRRLVRGLEGLRERAGIERGARERQEHARPLRIVGVRQRHRTIEVRHGGLGVQSLRPFSGERQEADGLWGDRALELVLTGGARQIHGRHRVVREDLRHVVHSVARLLLDPRDRGGVLGRPRCTGDLAVGHVADQDVGEGELLFTLERGAGDRRDQVPRCELSKGRADVLLRSCGDGGHRAGPERAADDGGVGHRGLAVRRERVDPCRDHRVHRARELELGGRLRRHALPDQPCELAREQRVPADAVHDRVERSAEHRVGQPVREQHRDLISRERLQVDPDVVLAREEPREPRGELGPRRADHEQRGVQGSLVELAQERQERVVGPMEILEDDDARLRVGDEREVPAPRREQLTPVAGALGLDPHERRQALEEPRSIPRLGERPLQPLERDRGRVRVADARVGLHHLAERPEPDAVAVGEAAAVQHADALPAERRGHLRHQSRLPEARLAEDRRGAHRRLVARVLERSPEQLQLLGASGERSDVPSRVAGDGRSEARPGRARPDPASPST